MAEPTVQVPVSVIESLAERAEYAEAITVAADLRALLSQPTPTAEACSAETHSWDHFRPEQIDPYWIRCTDYGDHEKHRDSITGLTWSDPSTIRDVTPPSTGSADA